MSSGKLLKKFPLFSTGLEKILKEISYVSSLFEREINSIDLDCAYHRFLCNPLDSLVCVRL